MTYLIIKYLVTALLIVVVSEIARRTEKFGALIGALPFIAVMVMIWLYVERQGPQKIGNYSLYTFWYVIPTLPMFLLMPTLMARQLNFWLSLLLCAALTAGCFVATALVAKRLGVNLIP
jgi:hypothetical protein